MKEEKKYYDMIEAFEADFYFMVNGDGCKLMEIGELIEKEDKRLMNDIYLLSELAYNIKHGKIKIMNVGE